MGSKHGTSGSQAAQAGQVGVAQLRIDPRYAVFGCALGLGVVDSTPPADEADRSDLTRQCGSIVYDLLCFARIQRLYSLPMAPYTKRARCFLHMFIHCA